MRPFGVSLIAVLMFLIGFSTLIGGLYLLSAKEFVLEVMLKKYGYILNETFKQLGITEVGREILLKALNFLALFSIVFGSIYVITGYGLWTLKEWGRVLAVIICGINAIYGIFVLFTDLSAIIYVVVNLLIIWYLMRRDIRESFRVKSIEERILGDQNP